MTKYRFQFKTHLRDDMYKTETVEIELTDFEFNNIKSDDNKYTKGSALLSSKLGQSVQVLGFPTRINTSIKNEKNKKKKSSLWRPLWAMPFKLIWRLITGF